MIHTQKTQPAPNPDGKDYHFKVKNLTVTPEGKFCHTYGIDGKYSLVYDTLPSWARTTEKANQILDGSTDPKNLRQNFDKLYQAAETDYMSGSKTDTNTKLIAETIHNQDDKDRLIDICQLRIADEERNAHGAPMAGALCSETIKFGKIIAALKP